MERKNQLSIADFLGLPKCSTTLYGGSNALHLPFRSLIEEFKLTKMRTPLLHKSSKDTKVAGAVIEICSGRKWKASREIHVAEE